METGVIAVKAYAVLLDRSRTRHAVWVSRDASKEPPAFHRLLGGHVEFGERAADSVVREIAEELGAELAGPTLLGVLESVFVYCGEPGHEVDFVYTGSIPDEVIPSEGGWFDDGGPIRVEWRPVDASAGDPPLYPDGVQELIEAHIADPDWGGRSALRRGPSTSSGHICG